MIRYAATVAPAAAARPGQKAQPWRSSHGNTTNSAREGSTSQNMLAHSVATFSALPVSTYSQTKARSEVSGSEASNAPAALLRLASSATATITSAESATFRAYWRAIGPHCGAIDRGLSNTPSLSVIARAPDFTQRDTAGKTVKLSDYRGRAVLLAFIFTTCPSVCPLISKQMEYLQTQLKSGGLFGRRAAMLSVTIDPETDTAPVLAAYAKQYSADPAGWRFLRESEEKTRPILKAYDEWTKKLPKGELDHPARVYLIDPNGNIREIYSLAFFNEKQALIDMKALLAEAR